MVKTNREYRRVNLKKAHRNDKMNKANKGSI